MIFDTHIHFNDERIYQDFDKYFSEAIKLGVNRFLCIGYDLESSKLAINLAEKHKEIYAAIGVIPTEHKQYVLKEEGKTSTIDEIRSLAKTSKKVISIGEIGLDYYWENAPEIKEKQKIMFKEQIELANELNLPISIHCRNAIQDCYNVLKENKVKKTGIMHCYSGSKEMAKEFEKLGYKIAFGGVLTFKNSKDSKETLLNIKKESIVFETDAPYLAPTPYRGKMNEPKYICETIKYAAEMLNLTYEEMQNISFKNSLEILNIKYE
ncbi:MAG: TatD family hydrolase [Bacilli bacterium]|nr:TatD family hydrolase [Bacilli bacterium]